MKSNTHGERDQQRHHAEGNLDRAHRHSGAGRIQEFSRTTPSIKFATSSQRSVIDSSCS